MNNIYRLITIMLMSLSGALAAAEIQPVDSIVEVAKRYLEDAALDNTGNSVISINQPDPLLRMPLCSVRLTAFAPAGFRVIGNTSIGVKCEDEKPWTLYLNATVKHIEPVLVAAHYIARNTAISKDDIIAIKKDTSMQARGYYTDENLVVGRIARYGISENSVITPGAIKKPLAVKRGEIIQILAATNGLKVVVKGKALMDGTVNDTISAKNLKSKKIIHGKIIGKGLMIVQI